MPSYLETHVYLWGVVITDEHGDRFLHNGSIRRYKFEAEEMRRTMRGWRGTRHWTRLDVVRVTGSVKVSES